VKALNKRAFLYVISDNQSYLEYAFIEKRTIMESLIGKKLGEIKGFSKFDFFVKFVQSKFANDIVEGKLFMNNLQYYIDLEEDTRKKGQGDRFEGAEVYKGDLFIMMGEDVIGTSEGYVTIKDINVGKVAVFCCTRFTENDFVIVDTDSNQETITVNLDINENDKNHIIENFGDKAVLLPNRFPNIIKEAAREQGIIIANKDVKYVNYNVYDERRREAFETGHQDIVFYKDDFFKSQKEYRIAITDRLVEKNTTFTVGKLNDFNSIRDTKEFMNDFTMKITSKLKRRIELNK